MSTPLKRPSKKPVVALPENRTASELLADTLLSRYNDLAPSVKRIMDAGMGETGRLHALTLFQESLGVTGDPMRNPLNTIAAGQLKERELG